MMRLTFQVNQTTRQSLRFEISAGVNKPVQLVSPLTMLDIYRMSVSVIECSI